MDLGDRVGFAKQHDLALGHFVHQVDLVDLTSVRWIDPNPKWMLECRRVPV